MRCEDCIKTRMIVLVGRGVEGGGEGLVLWEVMLISFCFLCVKIETMNGCLFKLNGIKSMRRLALFPALHGRRWLGG